MMTVFIVSLTVLGWGLLVGLVTAPNKRIEDVIRAFHAYKREFNPRSRLLIVGSGSGQTKVSRAIIEVM